MAYFFFVDESGVDRQQTPYEVICGIAIEDRDLWTLVRQIKQLEKDILGTEYRNPNREIKGKKFLKNKVFRQAADMAPFQIEERTRLAKECLVDGEHAGKHQMIALAQAKLAYVEELLTLCNQYRLKIFASITTEPIRDTDGGGDFFLRRDYVYLLERMYYYLEDKRQEDQGVLVFDELEKTQSHILIGQIENYFKKTSNGRLRSNLLIPEPFFVHSDLTTGVQIADLIAYIITWGMRLRGMNKPARPELNKFIELIKPLRYLAEREVDTVPDMKIWSVCYVK